jgi:hypothetical protein
MSNDNFDANTTARAVHEIARNSRLRDGWDILRIQAKQTEKEIMESEANGKGGGLRMALLRPRGVYADVLSRPLFG